LPSRKKQKTMKRLKTLIALITILLTSLGITHAFVFPQQTRCILIDYYDFEQEGNLYFRKGIDVETKLKLEALIEQAELRVADFWGEKKSNPKFIYCESDEDYMMFGVPVMTPASANMKLGAYVVISKTGVDLDIISHEISHTELFERIGFFNREFKMPSWFDEGLAMQVDLRDYYSSDALKAISNNFKELPEVTKMSSNMEFWEGSREQVMLNYATARYEVGNWYTSDKLKHFIKSINSGVGFEEIEH